ncbi:MAG: NADH dehydrogenase FAD-containing subunit [Candidatus Riflebacteria bacterium]|nr:NADH dehydrogenase FAD-containing subunit [Candidatus Riflebacteria bacterium]
MLSGLILIPLICGLLALFLPFKNVLHFLLIFVAVIHVCLTLVLWNFDPQPIFDGCIAIDALGKPFLTITSLLFLMSALFGLNVLRGESHHYSAAHQGTYVGCLLIFLSTMTLVTLSQHFGLFWVAVEATTLSSAPLIYFHRNARSLEATWKYLVICSVGIALALMGNFLLAVALSSAKSAEQSMILKDLIANAPKMAIPWLKVAFIFFLIGYGSKMGLAPMHTWLPDAHSEAPSNVSCLLSGALLNCACLGILRAKEIVNAAGIADFGQDSLIFLGLLSMAFSAVFMIGQTDYKRMLAYSSVEHMGIITFGIGLGGAGVFGSIYHAINHSLAKGLLFLTAGNILENFKTKAIANVSGIKKVLPTTGFLWIAGFLAITGMPPFGTFVSEFSILKAALEHGKYFSAILFLFFLFVIFVGMAKPFLSMAYGTPSSHMVEKKMHEKILAIIPPIILCSLVLIGGLYLPSSVMKALKAAAALLGG